jgi:radical SAM superfamily enzyme YgiQ (UPF0313 family)
MQYEGNVIRPPSEADSIILQVTVGCSHNKCTFCGAYRQVRFRIKSDDEICEDLEFASQYCRRQKRVFLADGDVLSLSFRRLHSLFLLIRKKLPWISRISLYGNAKNVCHKTVSNLETLRGLGLDRVYMGLESGHIEILRAIGKGVGVEQMIEAAGKIKKAGLFLSVTALLGLGGAKLSGEHAIATGKILSLMSPDQIAVLTLMLLPGTPLFTAHQNGSFSLPSNRQLIAELKLMVENINIKRGQLHANHASNYLPIAARLPRDKGRILSLLDMAVNGQIDLKPEHLRTL